MTDGIEPHDHIQSAVHGRGTGVASSGMVGGGVPGVWDEGGVGRGYTGYPPDPPQDPYLVYFWLKDPTYGQMKAILEVSDEVS